MSKRLSDTEIWKKPWFFDLPDKYKLFWFYLLSDCDAAGVWTMNTKITKAYLGEIDFDKIIEVFKDQITILNGGNYWLINDFIKFQYGYPIKETAPMFKRIDTLLKQRNLSLDTLYNTVSIEYQYSIDTVKDKEEDKEEDKKGIVKGKKQEPPITVDDLTDKLKAESYTIYSIISMLLDSCPEVMSMKYPISINQLNDVVRKWGAKEVIAVIKSMENKGIDYLKKHNCNYTFLTIDSWLNADKRRRESNVR